MKGTYSEHRSPSSGRRGVSITPNIYPDDTRSFGSNSPGNPTIRSRFQTHFKPNNNSTNGTKVSVSYRDSDEFFTFGTKTALRSPIINTNCVNQNTAASKNSINNGCEADFNCNSSVPPLRRNCDTQKVSSPTPVNTEFHPVCRRDNSNNKCCDNEEDFEEIIEEEEIRTIRKKAQPVHIVNSGLNAAVGDTNINSVKVLEMNDGCIDLNSLSDEQFYQLEQVFRRRMNECQPGKQDLCVQSCVGQQNASTMFRPPSPPPSRNVGMIFKPMMNECGMNTACSYGLNDVATNYGESDEEIQCWFKERIGYMTSANQKLVLKLADCYKNDRKEFLGILSEIISKQKVSVGLECRPEVETRHVSFAQQEYSNSIGVGEDSVKTVIKSPTFSTANKGCSMRPDFKTHSCNTENVMTRTQASMACPIPVETVEHGMVTEYQSTYSAKETNTECIDNNTFHGQTPSEFLTGLITTSALESAKEMYEQKIKEYRSTLISTEMNTDLPCQDVINIGANVCSQDMIHKDIDATDPLLLKSIIEANIREEYQLRESTRRTGICQTQVKPQPVNSYIHNVIIKASSIGPVREAGTGCKMEPISEDRGITAEETAKSKLLLESWEATTEYDEKSNTKCLQNKTAYSQSQQNHQLLSQNSQQSFLQEYSTQEVPRLTKDEIDRLMSANSLQSDSFRQRPRAEPIRMRDIPTRTEVVLEDCNGVAISSNYDVAFERMPSNAGRKKRVVRTDQGESLDRSEAHILQHSNLSNINNVYVDKNNLSGSTNLTQTNVNHNEFPYNVKFDSSASRFPKEFGLKRKDSARQASSSVRSSRRKIPSRTYQYNMNESIQKCCSHLSEVYRCNQFGPLDEMSKNMLKQIVLTWFDIIKTRPIDENVVMDFVAILYQYSPNLLESVINCPDENGSTALHYAVGHGAWQIVNCLLNTQFMDVDKFNFSGYTPVMVSAISQANTQEDLEVIDKMLNSSNVDLRSKAQLQQTPLILASRQGSSKIVDLLLLHRASVNVQDKVGNTALMCAVDQGHAEVVRKLLQCSDIDLSLEDNDSKDALAIAKLSGNQEIVEMITSRIKDATKFVRNNQTSHRYSHVYSSASRNLDLQTNQMCLPVPPRIKSKMSTKITTDDSCSCSMNHRFDFKSTLFL